MASFRYQAWGGIPEIKALSTLYQVKIGVVVIQDVEVLRFGHNPSCYERRIYVLYDGTHKNLCVNALNKSSFFPDDESVD